MKLTTGIKVSRLCNWVDCHVACRTASDLENHVVAHINSDTIATKSNICVCQWNGCLWTIGWTPDVVGLLTRHLLYHCYLVEKTVQGQLDSYGVACQMQPPLVSKLIQIALPFQCPWLGCAAPDTNSILQFFQHVNGVHVDNSGQHDPEFCCNWYGCGPPLKTFTSKKALLSHVRRDHTEEAEVICPGCTRPFFTLTEFKSHLAKKQSVMPYTCMWVNCGEDFHDIIGLERHVISHVQTPSSSFEGIQCQWLNCRVVHQDILSPPTNTCTIPDPPILFADALKRHLFIHCFLAWRTEYTSSILKKPLHKGLPTCKISNLTYTCSEFPWINSQFECRWNGCSFTNRSVRLCFLHVVDTHGRSGHDTQQSSSSTSNANTNPPKFVCQWLMVNNEGCTSACGKEYSSGSHNLRRHLRSHLQWFLLQCPECQGVFHDITRFTEHMNPSECPENMGPLENNEQMYTAQKTFIYNNVKTEHRPSQNSADIDGLTASTSPKSRTRVAGVKKSCHACPHCQRLFVTKHALSNHLPSHITSFPCTHCPQDTPVVFKSSYALRKHIRTKHSGPERQMLSCPLCTGGKEYASVFSLKRHIQQCHDASTSSATFICSEPDCVFQSTSQSVYVKHWINSHSS